MNLPDRLGESDTDAILRSGRAYGVAAAIAVGVVAYMSGGVSGVEMGGAVAATAPAAVSAVPFFQDNFDTGDTLTTATDASAWDEIGTGGGGSFAVNTTNAFSGSHSLAMTFGPDISGADSRVEPRLEINGGNGGAGYSEVWVEYMFYVPANFQHRDDTGSDNNKWFRIWAENYTGADPKAGMSFRPIGGATTDSSFVYGQFGSAQLPIGDTGDATTWNLNWNPALGCSATDCITAGTWGKVQMHFRLATTASSNDGLQRMCNDDVVLFQNDTLDWFGTGVDGNTLNQAYIMGAANSGYASGTTFYLDDLKMYNENPGWICEA